MALRETLGSTLTSEGCLLSRHFNVGEERLITDHNSKLPDQVHGSVCYGCGQPGRATRKQQPHSEKKSPCI